jgi:hypothetical protein
MILNEERCRWNHGQLTCTSLIFRLIGSLQWTTYSLSLRSVIYGMLLIQNAPSTARYGGHVSGRKQLEGHMGTIGSGGSSKSLRV